MCYITEIWCPKRDSNSQNLVSKTNTYTNSVIGAKCFLSVVVIIAHQFTSGLCTSHQFLHQACPPPTRHGQNSRVANAGLVDPMDEPMSSNLIEKNHPTEDNSVSFPLGQSSSCEAACSIIQLYLIMVTMSSILFLVRLAGIEPARLFGERF